MSSEEAKRAVRGWLKVDPMPLRAQLGNQVKQADVFTDDDGEPIYYVIYLKPSGFVIVPAEDLVEPIIAFADDGTYDPSPDNPLGALVSRDVPGRIAAARDIQALASSSPRKLTAQQTALEEACLNAQSKWTELNDYSDMIGTLGIPSVSDVRVAPFVQSRWSQTTECGSACYNYYTPPYSSGSASNYPCGCVATAMAQLMRYWQHPTAGVGTGCFTIYVDGSPETRCLRGGNGSGGPYNWADMVLDPGCGTSSIQRAAIGALTHDAGVAVNMDYSSGGSGADTMQSATAFKNTFGYSKAVKGYNSGSNIPESNLNTMLNPNMDSGFPCLLGITGTIGGHAIVCDGYGYNTSTLYHHLNLGWAGSDDAWYDLPTIDTSLGTFTSVYKCVYNVYVTGSGEIISGRVTDTSGVPISGATVTGTRTGGGVYNDTTDDKGIYALSKIPSSSTYNISVTKSGYTFTNQVVSTLTSSDYSSTSGNKWGINFVGTVAGPTPPTAEPNTVSVEQGTAETIELQASDDGLPDPPGVLSYIITSLPSHGRLTDPCTGKIESVPYTLADNGNQVVYTHFCAYVGSDSFGFKANDGGDPPSGGDSGIATITISVQPPAPITIYETGFNGGLPSGWTIIDYLSDGYTWTTYNYYLEQVAEWTGKTYMVAGYEYTGVNMDEQLITHSIDCSGLVDVKLSFKHILKHYSSEKADVDIRVNGGAWQNLQRYSTTGEYTITGVVEKDLSSIADGQSNVQIRWRYYDADWEWYWGIDDVKITGYEELEPPPQGDFEQDCDVDYYDFAIFASAWLSSSESGNWNPICDIYEPADDFIDFLDYAVFANNWLSGL
ncbi:MAG: C10 family peptidase [Sedimentisphaerales bacterium]|nr:C10 family peptidase [Sedimentisphaerales bacterium]